MPTQFRSPLLFPVSMSQGIIKVLDETKLPFIEEYTCVKTLSEALTVLGSMKTRSLGQVLLFFYACVVLADADARKIAQEFHATRPTFDFMTLAEILEQIEQKTKSRQKAVELFLHKFDQARKTRAERLAFKLPNPAKVLTICNINGELLYLEQALRAQGKESIFYVAETRPYLQGSRLSFWELTKACVPCRLLCDNQIAWCMKEKMVNCVVSGADRASRQGGIVNKTGTYALAVLSKHFGIPFYAFTQYPKDIDISKVEIEERNSEEIFMFCGDLKVSDGIYPAFDIIPGEYVTEQIILEGL